MFFTLYHFSCFSCALSMLVSIISAFFVVFVIVGLLVYFFYYHDKDTTDATKISNEIQDGIKNTFDKIKDKLN